MDRKFLVMSLATAILNLATHQAQAAPPGDAQLPDAYEPVGSGTTLSTAPDAPVGCFGITANPRTTATFTDYQTVAERPAGSYFSPIPVFSGPASFAPANATFINATVYMAPERLSPPTWVTVGAKRDWVAHGKSAPSAISSQIRITHGLSMATRHRGTERSACAGNGDHG